MSLVDAVQKTKGGVQLKVHVVSQSSQSVFPSGYNQWRQSLETKVQAKAQDNKANDELVRLIASFFQIPNHFVVITGGLKQREKAFVLREITYEQVIEKLREVLNEAEGDT